MKRGDGFTLVELVVVIAILGVLSGLLFASYIGIQREARNTERQADIKTLHSQLEAYRAFCGYYPTLGDLNDSNFIATNFKGFDTEALRDPLGGSTTVQADPAAKVYAYTASPSNCNNLSEATRCSSYTLTATLEGKNSFTRNSLE